MPGGLGGALEAGVAGSAGVLPATHFGEVEACRGPRLLCACRARLASRAVLWLGDCLRPSTAHRFGAMRWCVVDRDPRAYVADAGPEIKSTSASAETPRSVSSRSGQWAEEVITNEKSHRAEPKEVLQSFIDRPLLVLIGNWPNLAVWLSVRCSESLNMDETRWL